MPFVAPGGARRGDAARRFAAFAALTVGAALATLAACKSDKVAAPKDPQGVTGDYTIADADGVQLPVYIPQADDTLRDGTMHVTDYAYKLRLNFKSGNGPTTALQDSGSYTRTGSRSFVFNSRGTLGHYTATYGDSARIMTVRFPFPAAGDSVELSRKKP